MIGAAGLLLALQFIKLNSITVRLPEDNNKIIHLVPVDAGDRFSLTYRHSVEKTLVKGIFQVSQAPSILAVETRMTSVGTGLPNTFSKRTSRDGKWIVVNEEKKEIDNFRFFISQVNDTYLTTPNGIIDLMTLPSGTVILLGVEKISFLHYFLNSILGLSPSLKLIPGLQISSRSSSILKCDNRYSLAACERASPSSNNSLRAASDRAFC
ncbi:MAG: hypothetical protein BA862_07030 [Desulfobulbaceae bacterium S3730MH12]|nr:MAG: hypothetical protein BA866_01665 [Desulfobulbaceae bacterium S5133MH15]OEU55481.1 MAG: hypothetical protein BA862_07030 [Desulfobulbaceae bacterium S3730MH12]